MKDKKNTPQVLARRALLVLLDAAIVAFSFILRFCCGQTEQWKLPGGRITVSFCRKSAMDRGGVHCQLSVQRAVLRTVEVCR